MTPQPTRKRESSSYDGWLYVETEAVCTCACMCELTKVALTEIALSSALTLHCGLFVTLSSLEHLSFPG